MIAAARETDTGDPLDHIRFDTVGETWVRMADVMVECAARDSHMNTVAFSRSILRHTHRHAMGQRYG